MKRCVSFSFLLAVLLTACGPARSALPVTQDEPTTRARRSLTVFAAASLTGAFGDIGKAFEAADPGVTVVFNFAGSQALRTQIEQGASADIFASADHKNMDVLVSENLIAGGKYQDFADNRLVVILPQRNPANIQTLQDLARPGIKLDLADASVPVGNYARQALTNLGKDSRYGSDFGTKVLANVVSNETDVKQVVSKVDLGEADAGIVYVTDARAASDLKTIPIPDSFNVVAKYPIAVVAKAPNAGLAAEFIAYVLSADGQAVLEKWGFAPSP
ncbi:MAG TPA: molybdate ABC transporter substrate-binding protein [Anaerolineales bacterium]